MVGSACVWKQRNLRTFNGLSAGAAGRLEVAQVEAGAWALHSGLVSVQDYCIEPESHSRSLYLCGRSSGADSRAMPIVMLMELVSSTW